MFRKRNEKGAALIEMAIVTGLLLTLAIGAVEFGFAFKQWIGLSSSARSGVRVAASLGSGNGDPARAAVVDCAILESVAATLASTTGDEVISVRISKYDLGSGSTGPYQEYRPFDPDTDNPSNLACNSWFRAADGWPAANRDADGATRDWVQIRVNFRHSWVTGLFTWSGEVDWSATAAMRLEPQV